METNNKSIMGWVLVFFFTLVMAVMTYNLVLFPAFAVGTMKLYGIGQAGLTTLASVTAAVAVFTGIFFGRMVDLKGSRKIITTFLTIGIVLFFARAFVTYYPVVLLLTFLASASVSVCQVAAPKVLDTWFPKEKVGSVVIFQVAGAGIGSSIGFALGAILSLKIALISIAVLYVILLVYWLAVGKEGPYKSKVPTEETTESTGGTKEVLKSSYLWFITIAYSLGVTATLLINTYVVNAFISKGLEPAGAAMIGSILNLALLVGGFFASFLVAKVQRFNLLTFVAFILGSGIQLIAWFTPLGVHTWVLMGIGGLVLGGCLGLSVGRIPLIPMTGQFSHELIGTASGAVEAIKGIISFILPVGVAIIFGTNFNAIFIVFFLVCVLGTIAGSFLVPELGEKGRIFKEFQSKIPAKGAMD